MSKDKPEATELCQSGQIFSNHGNSSSDLLPTGRTCVPTRLDGTVSSDGLRNLSSLSFRETTAASGGGYGGTFGATSPRGIDAVCAGVSGLTSFSSSSSYLSALTTDYGTRPYSSFHPHMFHEHAFSTGDPHWEADSYAKRYKEEGDQAFAKGDFVEAARKYEYAEDHSRHIPGRFKDDIVKAEKALAEQERAEAEKARPESEKAEERYISKAKVPEEAEKVLALQKEAEKLYSEGLFGEARHKFMRAEMTIEKAYKGTWPCPVPEGFRVANMASWCEWQADCDYKYGKEYFAKEKHQKAFDHITHALNSTKFKQDRFDRSWLEKIKTEIKADDLRKEADALVAENKYTDAEVKYREAKDLSEHKPERFDAGITEVTRLIVGEEKAETEILEARLAELAVAPKEEEKGDEYALGGVKLTKDDDVAQDRPKSTREKAVELVGRAAKYHVDEHAKNTKAEDAVNGDLFARKEKTEGEHVCTTALGNLGKSVLEAQSEVAQITAATSIAARSSLAIPVFGPEVAAGAVLIGEGYAATVVATNVLKELGSEVTQECLEKTAKAVGDAVDLVFGGEPTVDDQLLSEQGLEAVGQTEGFLETEY